jgi:glutamate-1-semialdehyde 2,1-aminomutase
MDFIAPDGPVYQAGTLSGNPMAMAAGLAMLSHLKNNQEQVYTALNHATTQIVSGIRSELKLFDLPYQINQIGSMMSLFFTSQKVTDFESAASSDSELFKNYFQNMLAHGVYLPPSQYESWFISTAVTPEVIEQILEANSLSLKKLLS